MPTVFQQMEADLLFDYLPEHGRLALDVGANEGFWSRELARRFEIVHAYEPQAGITHAPDNVTVFNVAVGDEHGEALFRTYANSEHATMMDDRPDVGYGPVRSVLAVEMVALDEVYDRDVDFIKIDVEGAEAAVLHGARGLLASEHPELLIEIHSSRLRRSVLEQLSDYVTTIIPNPTPGAGDEYCWIHAD